MPQPVLPMSDVTERLMRSSTDAMSRRDVMSWLVAYNAASSSARRPPSSSRRRCSIADASGCASSSALSVAASSNAAARRATRLTAPNTRPCVTRGTSSADRQPRAPSTARLAGGTVAAVRSSTRTGDPVATTRSSSVSSSGNRPSRGGTPRTVRATTSSTSNSARSASTSSTAIPSKSMSRASAPANVASTTSSESRELSSRVISIKSAVRNARRGPLTGAAFARARRRRVMAVSGRAPAGCRCDRRA